MIKQLALPLVAVTALLAGDTHIWTQGGLCRFRKGRGQEPLAAQRRPAHAGARARTSCSTPGPPTSGPWRRIPKATSTPAAAPAAKLYRIPPDGKAKLLAELDGAEIHAIAVDSKDRVYAATAPDGKVYRIAGNGKPEVFYDPKAKYIWALAFDSHGNLFVGTGDPTAKSTVSPPTAKAKSSSRPTKPTSAPWPLMRMTT